MAEATAVAPSAAATSEVPAQGKSAAKPVSGLLQGKCKGSTELRGLRSTMSMDGSHALDHALQSACLGAQGLLTTSTGRALVKGRRLHEAATEQAAPDRSLKLGLELMGVQSAAPLGSPGVWSVCS